MAKKKKEDKSLPPLKKDEKLKVDMTFEELIDLSLNTSSPKKKSKKK